VQRGVEQYLPVLPFSRSDPLFDVLLGLPFNKLRDLFVGERSQACGHASNLGFYMPSSAGRGTVDLHN
jgi:hypothetical protein